jgi:hypothetical protein
LSASPCRRPKPSKTLTRALLTIGAVAGGMLVFAGGLVAAMPALIAAGGAVLFYRCCAKLFVGS